MVDNGDTCQILNRIAEPFRGYAQQIWKDLNFGLCRSKVDFEKLKSSGTNKHDLADQFTLVLPYAGSQLKWEVIFDSLYPWFAPDFRFDDETFLSNVNDEFIEQHIPSLAHWNDKDPKALSCVITELTELYREHQKKLLCEDENSRAHFEYTALIGDCLTLENDVEILIGRGDSVSFMIKLNVDFSQLPGLYTDQSDENPGGECAVILVKYPNPTVAKLILSPFIANVIGEVTLPAMDRAGVLMDYVPMVTQLIDKKVDHIVSLINTLITENIN